MNALLLPLPLWYLLGRKSCVCACVLGVWRRDIFEPKEEESSTFFLCMTDFAYFGLGFGTLPS